MTELELKAHQALYVFAKYDKSFTAQEKALAYQGRVEEERKAKSKAEEVRTKKMEWDILKKKLAVVGGVFITALVGKTGRDQQMAIHHHLLNHHLLQPSNGPIRAKQITQSSSVIG